MYWNAVNGNGMTPSPTANVLENSDTLVDIARLVWNRMINKLCCFSFPFSPSSLPSKWIILWACTNHTHPICSIFFYPILSSIKCFYRSFLSLSQRIASNSRSIARTAIRRSAIGTTMGSAAANNIGVFGPTTLQTQIGSFSQNGKYQLQILAQPEQQHRAR